MPELTIEELSALFAWIVDAQAFLRLSEAAKPTVDKLIAYQRALKKTSEMAEKGAKLVLAIENPTAWDIERQKHIIAESADGYAKMWSDKNIAEFGNLL